MQRMRKYWRQIILCGVVVLLVVTAGLIIALNRHSSAHQTTQTTPVPVTCDAATNLIPNGDLQTIRGAWPLQWEPFQYGTNQASNQLLNDNYNVYASSTITAFTDGQAKWVFVPVPVQPQAKYCFSLDYKATVSSDVMARFVLTDGSVAYRYLGTAQASRDWTRLSLLFETPASVTSVQIAPELIRVGSIQTDNYVLAPVQ